MSASNDHNVSRFGHVNLSHDFFEVVGKNLAGAGKALTVGVAFAVIHYDHVKAGNHRDLVQVEGHVTGPENVEQRRWEHWLDEHVERAAANQSGVVLGIVVQVEGKRARLLFFHDLAGSLPDFRLDAASTDGADDGAVVAHQHFRGLE